LPSMVMPAECAARRGCGRSKQNSSCGEFAASNENALG
jgi:hypothetical protein